MPEKQTMVMPEAELEPRPGDLPIRLDRLDLCQQISLFKQLKSGPGVERLPGTLLIDGFGASETGGQGQSISAAGGPIESVARFSVNDETTVLDDGLHPVGPGVVGKLARRGHVPLGYYKDPIKTAATFPVIDGVR